MFLLFITCLPCDSKTSTSFLITPFQDDDSEEVEDMTINPTDAVLVCAHSGDEVSQLEVCNSPNLLLLSLFLYPDTNTFPNSSGTPKSYVIPLSICRFGYMRNLMMVIQTCMFTMISSFQQILFVPHG